VVAAEATAVVVNLGEIAITKDRSVELVCLGIGSCIVVCAYDPAAGVGGMAHVVLPRSDGTEGASTKYADVAVPTLLDRMGKQGAKKSRLIVKLVGGAQMLSMIESHCCNVGERNAKAVLQSLDSCWFRQLCPRNSPGLLPICAASRP